MNKKTITLLILNVSLLLIIFYLNGYRFLKSSFYKKDLITLEADSYEVLYQSRKQSIVKFNDIYKAYNFKGLFLSKVDDPYFTQNFMFDFLFDFDEIYPIHDYNKILRDDNVDYEYRFISDYRYLVNTKHEDLQYKKVDLESGNTEDLKYDKIKIENNLYLYTFKDIPNIEMITFEAYVDEQRIIPDDLIFDETYHNIQYDDKQINEGTFINPLEQLTFEAVSYSDFDEHKTSTLLEYSINLSGGALTTRFFQYEGNIYWTYDEFDEYASIYIVNKDEFNQAFEEFKRVLE